MSNVGFDIESLDRFWLCHEHVVHLGKGEATPSGGQAYGQGGKSMEL